MISKITGKITAIKPPSVVIEVTGIGYEVDLPMSDCADLSEAKLETTLYTHLVIREDAHLLYGFLSADRRDCFRQLLKVSGIGPKIGLALLSSLSVEEIALAISQNDISILTRTPGIGKKVAERLLLELKGKPLAYNASNLSTTTSSKYAIHSDIAHALCSLGYSEKETNQVIKQLPSELADLSIGIKEALKLLNKH